MDPERTVVGKVALVTGASRGTGVDIALHLAGGGARVAVHYRSARSEAEDVVDRIRASGGDAAAFAADVSRADELRRLAGEVRGELGPVAVLVNNAGPFDDTPFCALDEAAWDYVMDANLKAAWLLAQLAAPDMEGAGWGRIVNIGSINSVIAHPNKSAYVSAKHGLLGLTRAAALESGPHGVTVNCVCPAYVRTPLVENQIADLARTERIAVEDVPARIMLAPSAVKRLIEPDEVAAYVRFLCSEEAGAITGSAQLIDGGWTAR